MYSARILTLTRQLYPTGRAFRMPEGGDTESLHKALAQNESDAFEDALAILNAILPDNSNFTSDDASDWEARLGIPVSPTVPLNDRKDAIIRKMNHPGTIRPRQNYKYLENQLLDAGFTGAKVFENRFASGSSFVTQTPEQILGSAGYAVHQTSIQHGQIQHGSGFHNKIANYVEEHLDASHLIGQNYRSTFFIGADPLGTFLDVPANRKDEFRQLILKIKPVQMVGYLFVNYI